MRSRLRGDERQILALGMLSDGRQWWRDGLGDHIFHQIANRAARAPAQQLQRRIGLLTQLELESPGHPRRIQRPGIH